jgi:ankyrin repeat protein
LTRAPTSNAPGGESTTALYHAAENENEAIIRLLLEKGADINA